MGTLNDRRSRGTRSSRQGLVAIAAIGGLVILSIVLATVSRTALAGTRQARLEEAAWQAEFLALAGVDFARAALGSNAEWKGATWSVPAEVAGRAGEVIARVESDDKGRRLEVVATFPSGDSLVLTRRIVVAL